jgi:hypothetical protein
MRILMRREVRKSRRARGSTAPDPGAVEILSLSQIRPAAIDFPQPGKLDRRPAGSAALFFVRGVDAPEAPEIVLVSREGPERLPSAVETFFAF